MGFWLALGGFFFFFFLFSEPSSSLPQAEQLAHQIGAATYVECSAKMGGENVENVFRQACTVALMEDPPLPHVGPTGLTVKRAR